MGILNWILQGCDTLTSTVSPSIDALGLRICIALATIMLVWFGVQEALASASGGPGFNMGKFLNFFYAYHLRLHDGEVLRQLDPRCRLLTQGIHQRRRTVPCVDYWNGQCDKHPKHVEPGPIHERPGIAKAMMNPYFAIVYVVIQVMIAALSAIVSAIIAYGAIGSAVIGLLGPLFIPFLVFQKLEFLFWGWLRAFIGFCFYKVLAAAVFSILGHFWRSTTRSL